MTKERQAPDALRSRENKPEICSYYANNYNNHDKFTKDAAIKNKYK